MRRPLTSQERAAEAVGGRPGRPSKLTAELARTVELDVAEGLTLRQVAARAGVDPRTILRRAAADPAFRARYAKARAFALEMLLDEVYELARAGAALAHVYAVRRRLMRRAPKRHGRPEGDRYARGGPGYRLALTLALRSRAR